MKRTLLFLAISMHLFACCGKKPLPQDSVVRWNPGDIKGKVKSIFTTTSLLPHSEDDDFNEPVATDVLLQVYNTKGELSESRWYDSDSTLIQKILFEYDLNGSLIRSHYIDYQKDLRQVDSSVFFYTYDSNKKPVKEETHHKGELLRWSETQYNSHSDITLHCTYQENGLVNEVTYEYSYNNDGRKTQEKSHNNGILMLTTTWDYDDTGRTIAVRTMDGEVSFTESYRYDNKNRLIEERLSPDGSGMIRITAYLYDENDNMIEYVQKTENENILRCCKYTYDKHGNWIRSTEQAGSGHIVCERKIEYDELNT